MNFIIWQLFLEIWDTVPCNEECKTRSIRMWVEGCVIVGKKMGMWENEKTWNLNSDPQCHLYHKWIRQWKNAGTHRELVLGNNFF